jgi:hypothetical protein
VHAKSAEIQVLLEGVDLPASKRDLLRYAAGQDGADAALPLLDRLPECEFRTLDEVGEALAPVQPYSSDDAPLPHAESDLPSGGDDYVTPHPSSGTVRDDAPTGNPPQTAIGPQTKAQNEQQERQEKLLGTEE